LFVSNRATNCGGAISTYGKTHYQVLRSSFIGNAASTGGAIGNILVPRTIIDGYSGNFSTEFIRVVCECTFSDNEANIGSALQCEGIIANSTFSGGVGGDIILNGSRGYTRTATINNLVLPTSSYVNLRAGAVGFNAYDTSYYSATISDFGGNIANIDVASIVLGMNGTKPRFEVYAVNGIEQTVYPLKSESPIAGRGVFLWHDDAWENVAYSVTKTSTKYPVCGSETDATILVDRDQIGNPIEYPVTMGSLAITGVQIPVNQVSFDANGGSPNPSAVYVANGMPIGLLPEVTQGNYPFEGWFTANAEQVLPDTLITSNMTVFAHWATHKVTFVANGGAGTMALQIFVDGVEQMLTKNAFSYEGYTFVGWATSAGGNVEYEDGQSMAPTSDMTLYAVWEANPGTPIFSIVNGELTSVEMNGATEIVIPNGVRSIANYVFNGCKEMTSVTIPSSITNIGHYAFYQCDGLKSVHCVDLSAWCRIVFGNLYSNPINYAHNLYVNGSLSTRLVIPGDIAVVNEDAFVGCSSILTVEISNNVTSIGAGAFGECTGITNVMIGTGLTDLGSGVPFSACTALMGFNIADGNRSYSSKNGLWLSKDGKTLIRGINGNVVIPEGVTDIAAHAFSDCVNLTDVSMPNSVTNIATWAFYGCNGLSEVRIPNGVVNVGNAFVCCNELHTVNIGTAVTNIGDDPFWGCGKLAKVIFNGNAPVIGSDYWIRNDNACTIYVKRNSTGWNVEIPGVWHGVQIAYIDDMRWTVAFSANGGVGTMAAQTFEDGKSKAISANAFTYAGHRFVGWATSAGGDVVYTDGQNITVSSDMTLYAVWVEVDDPTPEPGPDPITELPSWYSTYDDGAYTWVWTEVDGGVSLTGFYSDRVTDDNPYGEWKRGIYPAPTGKVTIPSTVNGLPVVELGDCLFDGCDGLTGVEIPATVEIVGGSAFEGAGLVSVLLPDSVRSIGWRAFYGSPLESVNAPKSLESVGGYAFCGTPWLSAQGDFAFLGDGNLIAYQGTGTHVVLPASARVVCECAFDGLGIESVTIPVGVAKIGDYAFEYCENLVDVIFEGDMWDIDMDVQSAFYNTPWLANLANVAPSNDNFANAVVFEGQSGSVRGLSIGASVEDGEPLAARWDSTASLWWRWTAPSDGMFSFDTVGSTFDTVLGVYTGDSVAALTAVAENDDGDDGDIGNASAVSFEATAGTTYYIAVAGYRDAFGNVMLSWSMDGPVDVFPEPAPTPAPEPEPTPEPVVVPELYDETEIAGAVPTAAASVYDGYLVDAKGNVAGSIQVKVGKPKAGLASVKATVVVGAAKASLKAVDNGKAAIAADGPTTMRLVGGESCEVTLGAEGLSGTYGSYLIDGARNFFTSKVKSEQGAANDLLAKWFGPVNVVWSGGTASVSIGKNGKAKVTVTLADGTKATANAQLLVGEEWLCVPVVVTKKMNLAFALWLPRSGGAAVVEGLSGDVVVGKPGALAANAAFHVGKSAALWSQVAGKVLADYLPDGMAVTQSGAKWTLPKAGKVVYKDGAVDGSKLGDNPSALKLTYKAKDGSFKGSFKVYADNGGNLKATTVSVAGIVVGGVGYGTAMIKKVGSVAIQIQ